MARESFRQVLHEAGESYQRTRTRVRKSGTVTAYDEQTPEKKD